MKHQVELTALSSNLAAVRQQVEGSRRKMDMSEGKIKGLTQQLEGAYMQLLNPLQNLPLSNALHLSTFQT